MPTVHTVGAAAPATSTRAWLPQPGGHSAGDMEDGVSEAGTGELGSPDREKNGFKAARKVASKAGKAATKGANKMASALKKKLRHQPDIGEYQAAYGRMDGQPQIIGRRKKQMAPSRMTI